MSVLVVVPVVLSLVLPMSPQDTGAWQVMYTSETEMLVALETAEFRGTDRPVLYVHCKAGNPRVFLKPAPQILRLQFDDGGLFRGRFVDTSFGFSTDAEGRLVEETLDNSLPPLKGLENPGELVESLRTHERLYVRLGRGAERNHFELAGFDYIIRALNNPCAAPDGGQGPGTTSP